MSRSPLHIFAFVIAVVLYFGFAETKIFSEQIISAACFPSLYDTENGAPDVPLLYTEIPVSKFQVSNISPQTVTELDYTDWWYSKWEDCRYIFLPATANRKNLCITYETENKPIYLNGTKIISGEITSLLSEADEFEISVGDTKCGTLKIMQSNLGCIYISTKSGGLDKLDSNRYFTETGSALMLNADGSTEYCGEIEKISSHGNSSWNYSLKKPYNIKLPKKADLYGMGKAKKWILLGNYLDHSMMRNKTMLEMSKAAGMDFVMDSVFVDLYADGSYRGTYQLIERVQIQKNRVNITDLEEKTEKLNDKGLYEYKRCSVGANVNEYIENSYKYYDIPNDPDDITGGYLLEFQLWNRYSQSTLSGFVTSRGQSVKIREPEYASEKQVLYIRDFMQELEDAIYSNTGYNSKGKHYSEYIDVDSLAVAYLIQEISINPDCTQASFFFWKESDKTGDGKIHCGPSWDFDISCDNFPTKFINSDGNSGFSYRTDYLYTAFFPISGYDDDLTDNIGSNRPASGVGWIGQLYKRSEFVKNVAKIYFERFEGYLNDLTDTKQEKGDLITRNAKQIQPSAEMNNARWHMYGGKEFCIFERPSGNNFMECNEYVRKFLEKRKIWLSSLWMPLISPETEYKYGDVNLDSRFSISDLMMLKKYLTGDGSLANIRAGDMNDSGEINIFDLSIMKNELLTKMR